MRLGGSIKQDGKLLPCAMARQSLQHGQMCVHQKEWNFFLTRCMRALMTKKTLMFVTRTIPRPHVRDDYMPCIMQIQHMDIHAAEKKNIVVFSCSPRGIPTEKQSLILAICKKFSVTSKSRQRGDWKPEGIPRAAWPARSSAHQNSPCLVP